MNFNDILEQWENNGKFGTSHDLPKKKKEKRSSMEDFLDHYSPDSSVLSSKVEKKPYASSQSRTKMRKRKADFVLDLHGLNVEEAKIKLQNFIQMSYKTGAGKILIIHGKGNHTSGRAVLKPLVKSILTISPYIGDIGTPEKRDGGSGGTWAVIRQRSL